MNKTRSKSKHQEKSKTSTALLDVPSVSDGSDLKRAATLISGRSSHYAGSMISGPRDSMTIVEQQEAFYEIYKLLRVKKIKELRFTKKTRIELTKKFQKLSKVGIQQLESEQEKKTVILNPNSNLLPAYSGELY